MLMESCNQTLRCETWQGPADREERRDGTSTKSMCSHRHIRAHMYSVAPEVLEGLARPRPERKSASHTSNGERASAWRHNPLVRLA